MSLPYKQVFSRRASPFMRWALSPFLLLFSGVFFIPLMRAFDEQRLAGVITGSLVILVCVSGFLALWGVPFMGRIVTGVIALFFGAYLVDQCFIEFDGSWGVGERRSEQTPINSILGFLVFGFPCLIYTVFGRFTFRKPPGQVSDSEEYESDEESDRYR